MNINLGNYLENEIKLSKYTKKDLCNKLNELFTFGNKPISYTTFSNNVKSGDVTFNEIIAIATLIDSINLNKVVLTYKNELNKDIEKEKEKGDKENMKKELVKIFNENSIAGVNEYQEDNIYEIVKYEVYEGLYVSEDYKTAVVERIDISSEIFVIQEVAYFTNFDEILGETNTSINEFKNMNLNKKIDFISQEGLSTMNILGEDIKEKSFSGSNYFLNDK